MASEDREELIRVTTAVQVCNAPVYEQVLEENPMLAKYMMQKLLDYLTDEEVTTLERQTMLMNFLMKHTCYELIKPVLDAVTNSDVKDDYNEIILEWNFKNSEDIVSLALEEVDGQDFIKPIPKENPKLELKVDNKEKMDAVVEVRVIGLEPKSDEAIQDIINAILPDLRGEVDDGEEGTGSS